MMVGDSINDVQAARAAGMPILCVPYGYNEGRDPRSLECDALIDTLAELPALLLPRPLPSGNAHCGRGGCIFSSCAERGAVVR
jgi:hypothetical protein